MHVICMKGLREVYQLRGEKIKKKEQVNFQNRKKKKKKKESSLSAEGEIPGC